MTDTQILDTLTEIFRDIFDDDNAVITPQSTAHDHAAWDSLSNVNIMVAAEIRFGVRFKTSEVEGLENVGELIALIQRHLEAKG